MVSLRPDLLVMQENALSHKAIQMMLEFGERCISPIEWLPYSTDVNSIENILNLKKNYTKVEHPDLSGGKQRSQDEVN